MDKAWISSYCELLLWDVYFYAYIKMGAGDLETNLMKVSNVAVLPVVWL